VYNMYNPRDGATQSRNSPTLNLLQVSPIPIREALQQLQGEGLIVITPNRGATVRAPTPTCSAR
jgi:hypothetical protein